ncbi:MAG: DsbA family protein [Nocardioidaceae bacterium]
MAKKKSKATKQAEAQRAAERAAAIRREQETRERRRRTLWITLAGAAVLILVVAIVAAVQASRDTTGRAATPPAGAVDTYALPSGEPGAPVTVDVYEDFMCPFCGQFEASASQTLKEYAANGDAQIQYRMISFLDRMSSGSDYSTRAMNAVGVVLDEAGPDAAIEMHDLLYQKQPEEGTEGLTDDELVDLAVQAGADEEAVRGPIEDLKFEQWVKNATDQSSKDGVTGTPTIRVDGKTIDYQTIPELLTKLDEAVQAGAAQ